MDSINFEEDSEDIDFPPVIYSKDIKDEPSKRKKKSCLNKFLRILKLKKSLFFIVIGIIIIIIIIIIIVKLKKEKENSGDLSGGGGAGIDEGDGGYIIATYIENKTIINADKRNGLNDQNYNIIDITKVNSALNNLTDNETVSIENQPKTFNISFTKKLKSMKEMFKDITELIDIDLSFLKTDEITNLNSTFLNCTNLENITFGNFNSSNLKFMESTFENCSSLEKLNLSSFTNNKTKSMAKAFKNCISLTEINLSNFELKEDINFRETFDFTDDFNFTIINNNVSKGNDDNNNKAIYISIICVDYFKCEDKYLCQICPYIPKTTVIFPSTSITDCPSSNITSE